MIFLVMTASCAIARDNEPSVLNDPLNRIVSETCGRGLAGPKCSHLVDPASSHMLVSKIKPCMSEYKLSNGETANGSLK